MNPLVNPVTTHKHARWIALYAYIAGCLCVVVGYYIQPWWSIFVMDLGLILWSVPAMWGAYKWSKS